MTNPPREPTQDMINAGRICKWGDRPYHDVPATVWRAMYDAWTAQAAPAQYQTGRQPGDPLFDGAEEFGHSLATENPEDGKPETPSGMRSQEPATNNEARAKEQK